MRIEQGIFGNEKRTSLFFIFFNFLHVAVSPRVSGWVWHDAIDNDGVRNAAGEPGIENIEVQLLASANAAAAAASPRDSNDDVDPNALHVVASTRTDASGFYSLLVSEAGHYYIRFIKVKKNGKDLY